MSIRLKLILTYIIGIVLTAVIITATGIGLITAAISYLANGMIKEQTVEEAFHRGLDLFVDLRHAERHTPELLQSPEFIDELGERLEPFGGFIVVQQGEQWDSYGPLKESESFLDMFQQNVFAASLEEDEMFFFNTWEERDLLSIGYNFSELGQLLTYYLIIDVTDIGTKGERFPLFLLSFLGVLFCIILVPLLWITTKDIVRPLRKLEQGSQRIADGDLNFSLHSNVRNEVGSVIRSYEKMRSELQRSINAQLALEENRKQLISNISHDLKSPLTSIKGYVEGIREGIANDPEKLNKYIDVIHAKALDMDRMIDDLFLYSKLDLEQESFHFEAVPFIEFYKQTLNELQMEYESSGVHLTSEYNADSDAVITMDAQKIKRVIFNIIGNSVKFMDKADPHIHIQFDQNADEWVIGVTDNGPGMEQSELAQIFERFYRGDVNRNQNVASTGLGLAIAKQIVAQHGGTIQARSEKGTYMTVVFTIPIQQKRA